VLGLEAADLELDDHESPQGVVVEEQVQEELLAADDERFLAAVEREAGTELDQKALDVVDQRLFEFAFAGVLGKFEEVEDVGVLGRVQRGVGVAGFEGLGEVRQRGGLALVEFEVDLAFELANGPALLAGLPRVPDLRFGLIGEAVEQDAVRGPRDLCHR